MLQTTLMVMDLGLSPTLNRVLARYSAGAEEGGEQRDFVRTTEMISWGTGISVGILLYALAPLVSRQWIRSSSISAEEIRRTIWIICINLALQFPLCFYQGGLMGLQKQVVVNVVRIVAATAGGAGAAFILWKISSTPAAFFSWQIAVTVTQVAFTMVLLWRSLPERASPPRFDFRHFRNVWRFAAGMTGISITGLILTQMDKVILSKLLFLKSFGYYTLAGVVCSGLYVLIAPVYGAIFPRFSALVATGDDKELTQLYHRGAQFMAVLVLPAASVVALFPREILLLWTQNREVTLAVSPIVTALTIGTALNGLMHLPFALQLSHGWTRIGISINLFLIAVLLPATIILAQFYGATGGAAAWALLNILYVVIGIPLTHRRILKGETFRWFKDDLILPMTGAVGVVAAGRILLTVSLTPTGTLFFLVGLLICSSAVAAIVTPQTRAWLLELKKSLVAMKS
jgi:O-antigen/teichoic acid export membrane protein